MIAASFYAVLVSTGIWKRLPLGKKFSKKERRSPLSQNLLRGPGESLRQQETNIRLDLMADSLMLITTTVILAVSLLAIIEKGIPIVTIIIVTGYIPFFLRYARKLRGQAECLKNISLGLDGELATAQELNQLMRHGYCVYHDFPADKFNIDHIIIGKTGVYAVETKTKSKQNVKGIKAAKVNYDGNALNFPDGENTEFIRQAKEQAKWLSNFLRDNIGRQVFVTPVLALPGWWVDLLSRDDSVLVINPKQCADTIRGRREVLDEATINQIQYHIEKQCRTVEPYEIL
jgi:hypothetical protein